MFVVMRITSLIVVYTAFVFNSADPVNFPTQSIDSGFNKAREYIESLKPEGIIYNDICSDIVGSGMDKTVCRLKSHPSIALLVCKRAIYEEPGEDIACKTAIQNEMSNLSKLRSENIKVVTVDTDIIDDIKCGETEDKTCSGFLEAWIDIKDGEFGHIRDHVHEHNVAALIERIRDFTSKEMLQITITDLRNIVKFMKPSPDSYKQICDLQGFFLKNGGFLINDTPEIKENIAKDGVCWNDEPTTERVLQALNEMIEGLTKGQQ